MFPFSQKEKDAAVPQAPSGSAETSRAKIAAMSNRFSGSGRSDQETNRQIPRVAVYQRKSRDEVRPAPDHSTDQS